MAASRLIGFVRDLTVSGHWGAGEFSDGVLMLMNLPDLITNMLVGAAASALLVPRFVKSESDQVESLYAVSLEGLAVFAALVSVAVLIAPKIFVNLVVPGFSADMKLQIIGVLPAIALAIILTFAAGAPRAYLQSQENFRVSSFENIYYSLPLLGFLLLGRASFVELAAMITLASLCRFAYLQLGVRRHGITFHFKRLNFYGPTVISFISLLLSSSAFVVLFFILRAKATELGAGQFTLFSYYYKILEVPFGFLSTAIFSLALPRLSGKEKVDNMKHLKLIMGLSTLFSGLLAVVFYLVSMLKWSFLKLTFDDVNTILKLLVVGSLVLPGRLAMSYLQSMEFATQRSRVTLIASLGALGISTVSLYLWPIPITLLTLAWLINIYHYTYVALTLGVQAVLKRPMKV